MTSNAGRHLSTVIRVVLGLVFLYAGVLKIADPVAFAGNVAAYRLLPYFGNYLVATTLPWVETICGLMLIIGWRTRSAAALISLLNGVFMLALASTIIRGLDIDCGCFQQGAAKTSAWSAMGRDTVLLALSLTLLRRDRQTGDRTAG
ncbi:MAG: DoxX family protein [Geobacter sp.]|nr:MAG: DoxX family protein [Geobacter sp.]